jgi:hypothetical protein
MGLAEIGSMGLYEKTERKLIKGISIDRDAFHISNANLHKH